MRLFFFLILVSISAHAQKTWNTLDHYISGPQDPTIFAINAPIGTVYFKDSGSIYIKKDDFLSTNWSCINCGGTGIIPIASGGTGQTTAVAALNALLPDQSIHVGEALFTDGTNPFWQAAAGSGTVTSISVTAPLAVTSPTTTPALSMTQSSSSTDGWLSSADWSRFDALPTGASDTIAGFDSDGNLTSVLGWVYDDVTKGLHQYENVALQGNENFWDIHRDMPLTGNTNNDYNFMNLYSRIDPDNTMFRFGDGSAGGYNHLNLSVDRQTGGETGRLHIVDGGTTVGNGTDAGELHDFVLMQHGEEFTAMITVDSYRGYTASPNFDVGSILGGANMFQASGNFNGNTTGFIQAFGIFNNFGATSTTAHYHAIESGGNGNTTGNIADYINYNGYMNDVVFGSMTGIQFSPQNITVTNGATLGRFSVNNATFMQGAKILDLSMSGTASGGDVTGISINLDQLTYTEAQKNGLTINDGATNLQSNYDTAILTPNGEWQHNLFGGEFHISAGFPITNGSFGFGNNSGITVLAEDDMGPDSTGLGLGFTVNGLVNQLEVSAGKTFERLNYGSFGGGMLGDATGVINHATMVYALGFLPEGMTMATVNNMYGFETSPILCLTATNCWGVSVEDPAAENYLPRLSINTSTTKNATNVKLEVNEGHVRLSGTAATCTVNANAGTGATCTLVGNDSGGEATLTTGSAAWASGEQFRIVFHSAYNTNPICVFSPSNDNAAAESPNASFPRLATTYQPGNFVNPDTGPTTYKWSYACHEI